MMLDMVSDAVYVHDKMGFRGKEIRNRLFLLLAFGMYFWDCDDTAVMYTRFLNVRLSELWPLVITFICSNVPNQ